MFRSKYRGRHAARPTTATYVARGALLAGTVPVGVIATAPASYANTGDIPIVEVQVPPTVATPASVETYVVRSGDTLNEIAASHNTTARAIAAENGIANPDVISTGQILRIDGSTAPSATAGSAVVKAGMSYLGVPYSYGGTSRSGVDCSGLTQLAYAAAGVSLPRNSAAQAQEGTTVSQADAVPGDLVSFANAKGVHHVAIYLGNGEILHSPRPGKSVQVSKIWSGETVRFHRIVT